MAAAGYLATTGTAGAVVAHASLHAAISLSPTSTNVEGKVRAKLSGTTVPSGDKLTSIKVSWGDRTKAVSVAGLSSVPTHKYARPGRYGVKLTVTDEHGVKSSAVADELVMGPRGVYLGPSSQAPNTPAYDVTMYVSGKQTQMQDITFPYVSLSCTPGSFGHYDQMVLDSVNLGVNGTFSTTFTQPENANVHSENYPAKATYSFAGGFSGVNSSGVPVIKGTFSESLTYTAGSAVTCTSGKVSWSATLEAQPTQTTAPPAVGLYNGPISQAPNTPSYNTNFYVSPNRTQLQDITFPVTLLYCAPGGTELYDQLVLDSVTLATDGSFTATSTQNEDVTLAGVNYPATATLTFRGHFHGVDTNGSSRAAGSYSETLTYTASSTETCTSNKQSWYAAWPAQPAQPGGLPPPGAYAGPISQAPNTPSDNMSFSVSGDQSQLQDVTFPSVTLTCTPGSFAFYDNQVLPAVPLASNGSFDQTVTEPETVRYQGTNYPATAVFTFRGHFHGVDTNGKTRAAGSYTETVTFTAGSAQSCTSGKQFWYAAATG